MRIPRGSIGVEIWEKPEEIIECISRKVLDRGNVIVVCEPIVGLISLLRNDKVILERRQAAFSPGLLVLEEKPECVDEYYVFLKDAWGNGKIVGSKQDLKGTISRLAKKKNPFNICRTKDNNGMRE